MWLYQWRGRGSAELHQVPQRPGQRGAFNLLAGTCDSGSSQFCDAQGENTPVKIAALDDLRSRIKDIEYQEAWEAKAEVRKQLTFAGPTNTLVVLGTRRKQWIVERCLRPSCRACCWREGTYVCSCSGLNSVCQVLCVCTHRKLIGESDELRDLQELDRDLCVWREKVESTIDSRQPDRIAVRMSFIISCSRVHGSF